MMRLSSWLVVGALLALASCREPSAAPHGDPHSERHGANQPTEQPGIAIPSEVRAHLGLTFARVERRAVAATIRTPGRFEPLPEARREHSAPLAGLVTLVVNQYDPIEPGTLLYRLDAPAWRDLQGELGDTQAAIDIAQARLAALSAQVEAHSLHEQGLRETLELWTERVQQLRKLQDSGAGRASDLTEAQAQLTTARAAFGEVLEKDAEIALGQAEAASQLRSARARYALLLTSASALTDLAETELDQSELGAKPTDAPAPDTATTDGPRWQRIRQLEVRATRTGVVERCAVTNGAWVEPGVLVMATVDPSALRFRALGLQSDLQRLSNGLPAAIVPARDMLQTLTDPDAVIRTTLQLGLAADPEQRTIELLARPTRIPSWARSGVSGYLEITTDASAPTELAIPLACVQSDGLERVLFRRDPRAPDRVLRIPADLGLDDGRWAVIQSGVREGDEIVLAGAAQLLLVSSAQPKVAGHFHADGTFHADEEH